jgi:hypothetical protein
MVSNLAAAVEAARKKTVLIVLAIDILMVVFTMLKGHPSIWNEFDREQNAWTFWKASQMMLTAVVAYINYLLVSNRSGGEQKGSAWPWALLSVAFVFMAFDDMLILHERGGHAIENALPFLSRQHIVVYMDDLLEYAYSAAGLLYGVLFLRRLMPNRGTFRYYACGVGALVVATCIGLSPAMKSITFPMALIQLLHLLSVYMFFVSFTSCTSGEISCADAERSVGCFRPSARMQCGG